MFEGQTVGVMEGRASETSSVGAAELLWWHHLETQSWSDSGAVINHERFVFRFKQDDLGNGKLAFNPLLSSFHSIPKFQFFSPLLSFFCSISGSITRSVVPVRRSNSFLVIARFTAFDYSSYEIKKVKVQNREPCSSGGGGAVFDQRVCMWNERISMTARRAHSFLGGVQGRKSVFSSPRCNYILHILSSAVWEACYWCRCHQKRLSLL